MLTDTNPSTRHALRLLAAVFTDPASTSPGRLHSYFRWPCPQIPLPPHCLHRCFSSVGRVHRSRPHHTLCTETFPCRVHRSRFHHNLCTCPFACRGHRVLPPKCVFDGVGSKFSCQWSSVLGRHLTNKRESRVCFIVRSSSSRCFILSPSVLEHSPLGTAPWPRPPSLPRA